MAFQDIQPFWQAINKLYSLKHLAIEDSHDYLVLSQIYNLPSFTIFKQLHRFEFYAPCLKTTKIFAALKKHGLENDKLQTVRIGMKAPFDKELYKIFKCLPQEFASTRIDHFSLTLDEEDDGELLSNVN